MFHWIKKLFGGSKKAEDVKKNETKEEKENDYDDWGGEYPGHEFRNFDGGGNFGPSDWYPSDRFR